MDLYILNEASNTIEKSDIAQHMRRYKSGKMAMVGHGVKVLPIPIAHAQHEGSDKDILLAMKQKRLAQLQAEINKPKTLQEKLLEVSAKKPWDYESPQHYQNERFGTVKPWHVQHSIIGSTNNMAPLHHVDLNDMDETTVTPEQLAEMRQRVNDALSPVVWNQAE